MTITEIKSQLSILAVLTHYNLSVDRWNRLCCPWHNDKTPSLQIYPKTNTWTCFSSNCSAGSGDVIEFIQRKENLSKHTALQKAKELINPLMSPLSSSLVRPSVATTTIETSFLSAVFDYFKSSVSHSQSTKVRSYAKMRGLYGLKEMGYNSGKFHQDREETFIEKCVAHHLLKVGVRSHRVWAKHCLIFPLRNEQKEIVSLYGRSIVSNAKGKSHYYLKGRSGLYPAYPKRSTQRLILTESVIDAATLGRIEWKTDTSVLAVYGTEGFNEEHRKAILSCGGLQEIIFAFDGDEAGDRAVEKYVKTLSVLYPELVFSQLNLPEGEDVNSLYVGHEESAQALFSELLEQRKRLKTKLEKEEKKEAEISSKNGLFTENAELLVYRWNELEVLILGGINMEYLDRLKVTLKVNYASKRFRDEVNLYNARQRSGFIQVASERLECSHKELEEQMEMMSEALEKYRLSYIESRKEKKEKTVVLSAKEKAKAIQYLSSADLMSRTQKDIGLSGVIGEELNRLLMYIVYSSRKMKRPIHLISFGSSGSGKTHLQSSIAALIPREDKIETTALSDNAIYYFGQDELSHLLILIEDLDGAEGVLLPLRELQSKQEVRKTVTLKDRKGKFKTVTLIVKGPICLSGCTTQEGLYEDNANRSLLIYVDESKEQDDRITDYQKKLSAGKVREEEQKTIQKQFQNTQRLLRPIRVVNPYAEQIELPRSVFKPRRTNAHLLHFIEAITFYHQYQREVKTDAITGQRYIESTLEDIEWAFKLLDPVLLIKSDELGYGCRRFLERIKNHLSSKKQKVFYSSLMRKELRISPATFSRHLGKLLRYGHLKRVGGSRYHQGYEYEIQGGEDYSELKNRIQDCLQSVLEKLRKKEVKNLVT